MQRIERYGVIALVFLLVTILAVSLWGEGQGKDVLATVKDKAAGVTGLLASTSDRSAGEETKKPKTAPAGRRAADRSLPLGGQEGQAQRKRGGRKGGLRREETLENAFVVLDPRPSTTPVSDPVPTPASARRAQRAPRVVEPARSERRAAPVHERGASTAVTAASRTYVVRAGDTLGEIAQRELGTFKRWTEIQRLNGGLDPAKLRSGMKLKLPGGRVATASSAPAAQRTARPTPTTPAIGGSYVVRRGDSLSVIAQRRLGTASRWKEIVALNPGLDPNRMSVGAKLVMPVGLPAAQVRVQQVAAVTSSERGSRVR